MRRLAVTFICATSLAGCGGGGGGSSPPPAPPSPPAPTSLSYPSPAVLDVGSAAGPLTPTVTGTVTSYAVAPALPTGLSLDPATGVISGTPSVTTPRATHTVTASNAGGAATFALVVEIVGARATTDRPDQFTEHQVHLLYAVAADGTDRSLDVNGTIERSIGSSNGFMQSATGSQSIRYDARLGGGLDVSFLRLPDTDAFYASQGVFAREALQADVVAAGFAAANKLYLVYYDGTNPVTCGGAPPLGSGDRIAALYLRGTPPGSPACGTNSFAATPTSPPRYWEWAAAHEIVHALGFVQACAPHHNNAHTGDDPTDLMYAGNQPWAPTTVDPGRDDYYGANVPVACTRNLFRSAFLVPTQGTDFPPNF